MLNGGNAGSAAENGYSFLAGLLDAARVVPANLRAKPNSIPLTVLSGFLGSGKTTLVNRLLNDPGGRRITVLVNDFGSLDIDASLIRSQSADTISLANGCACCTVAGDLTRALVAIAQASETPDAILLEASGAADPRGIAQIALANPALSLAGVVTMIDAENFLTHLAESEVGALMRAQIEAADILALNKMDLIGDRGAAVRSEIAGVSGERPFLETTRSDLPADIVFGAHSRSRFYADPAEIGGHADAFRSWNLIWRDCPPEGLLNAALREMPATVLRAKGIFYFAGKQTPSVYQRAGRRWSFSDGEVGLGAKCESRLVVIGLASDADRIERFVEDRLRAT